MSFAEVRLPTTVAMGFTGGPEFSTDVVVLFNGQESRNRNRSDGLATYGASFKGKTRTVTEALVAFFRARNGMYQGFRMKDPIDYSALITEGVFVSLGSGQYQMYKRYTSGGVNHDRKILKPVSGALTLVKSGATVLVENTHFTVDYTTGIVSVLGSPGGAAPDAWAGQFDVPVRFTSDRLEITAGDGSLFYWDNCGVVELLNT